MITNINSSQLEPKVSVIIPTYEKHHKYLQEAVDSIQFELAEVIIVNDSDIPLEVDGNNISVINRTSPERWGTGKARNLGAKAANTELLLWLDSDDLFLPNGVNILYQAHSQTISPEHPHGLIVYGGLLRGFDNVYWPMKPQYCGSDIRKSGLMDPAMPYCIMIPKKMHEFIGGYDEAMITWEDVDYEKKITVAGLCAQHINSAVFWYRWESGERRDLSDDPTVKKMVSDHMYAKYRIYHEGREKLANCYSCGDAPPSPYKPNSQKVGALPEISSLASNEQLYLVYVGTDGVHTLSGPVTPNSYRWGKSSRKMHYRKLVVDKATNLSESEVNRQDAEEFIKLRRQGNSYDFKYEVEIVVGDAPIPLAERASKTRQTASPTNVNTPDADFIFEAKEKPITDFTISELEAELETGNVFKSTLQIWREQEARQEKPRKGILERLDVAIKSA